MAATISRVTTWDVLSSDHPFSGYHSSSQQVTSDGQ